MNLTPRQKKLVAIGRNVGRITRADVAQEYSDPKAARNAVERLVFLRLFANKGDFGSWVYRSENDSQALLALKSD